MNYLIVQLTSNEALFARFQLKRGVLVFDRASRETIDHEHPLAAMLAEASVGFLIHAPAAVKKQFPQFKPVEAYDELLKLIRKAM